MMSETIPRITFATTKEPKIFKGYLDKRGHIGNSTKYYVTIRGMFTYIFLPILSVFLSF